jgi:hypothetical protein
MRRPGVAETVLKERLIPSVPITVRVFYGCRYALARGKPWLAEKWEDVTRHESFEWSIKHDPMRIDLCDGHLTTFPIALSMLAESEGYKLADFDRVLEISTEDGAAEVIDENMLLGAMPTSCLFCRANEPTLTSIYRVRDRSRHHFVNLAGRGERTHAIHGRR